MRMTRKRSLLILFLLILFVFINLDLFADSSKNEKGIKVSFESVIGNFDKIINNVKRYFFYSLFDEEILNFNLLEKSIRKTMIDIVDLIEDFDDKNWFDMLVKDGIVESYESFNGKENIVSGNYRFIIERGRLDLIINLDSEGLTKFILSKSLFSNRFSNDLIFSGLIDGTIKGKDDIFIITFRDNYKRYSLDFARCKRKIKNDKRDIVYINTKELVIIKRLNDLYVIAAFSLPYGRIVFYVGLLVMIVWSIFLITRYFIIMKSWRVVMEEEKPKMVIGNPLDEIDKEIEAISEAQISKTKNLKETVSFEKTVESDTKVKLAKDGIIIKK